MNKNEVFGRIRCRERNQQSSRTLEVRSGVLVSLLLVFGSNLSFFGGQCWLHFSWFLTQILRFIGKLSLTGPFRFRVALLMLWIVSCLSLISCQHSKSFIERFPAIAQQKTIVIGLRQTVDGFSPASARDGSSQEVMGTLFRPLWDWDESWHRVNFLLTDLPSYDDLHTMFVLKRGDTWSDGSPLTIDDLLFSYQLFRHPLVRDRFRTNLVYASGMKVKNESSLLVNWYAEGLFPDLGQNYVMHHETDRLDTDVFLLAPWFRAPAIGNGPFVIQVQTPDGLVLGVNSHAGTKPLIDRIMVKFYASASGYAKAITEEKCDLFPSVDREIAEDSEASNPSYVKVTTESPTLYLLWFNLENAELSNRVRQALFYAVPRRELADSIGAPHVPQSWLPKQHPFYKGVLGEYKNAPGKSIGLFHRMGWDVSSRDGKLRNRAGELFVLNCLYDPNDPVQVALFNQLAQAWGGIGITLLPDHSHKVSYDYAATHGLFDSIMIGKAYITPATAPGQLFSSHSRPGREGPGGNIGNLNDQLMDEYCEKTISDPETRLETFNRLQTRFAALLPFLPIGFVSNTCLYKKGLHGIRPRGFSPVSWNAENWSWGGKKHGK